MLSDHALMVGFTYRSAHTGLLLGGTEVSWRELGIAVRFRSVPSRIRAYWC
jgi:hypothetical protein